MTAKTRRESNKKVEREKRYAQVMSILKGRIMTAKEVAIEMNLRGFAPTSERNFAAPRLTELVGRGLVDLAERVCGILKPLSYKMLFALLLLKSLLLTFQNYSDKGQGAEPMER